jgi:hypothetical protein
MRLILGLSLFLCFATVCRSGPIDLGKVDRSKPPAADEIQPPKSDEGVPTVDLQETVTATIDKDETKHVYVLACPLSSDAAQKTWWVQREISRNGTAAECNCQFGEEDAGKGEYFAVIALVTSASFDVGQTLDALPKEGTYSKFRIVKRK